MPRTRILSLIMAIAAALAVGAIPAGLRAQTGPAPVAAPAAAGTYAFILQRSTIVRLGGPRAGVAWAPDGVHVAVWDRTAQGATGLVIIGLDGSSTRVVPPGEGTVRAARWSPDGSHLAFVETPSPMGATELDVVQANGDGRTLLRSASPIDFAWTPDGAGITLAEVGIADPTSGPMFRIFTIDATTGATLATILPPIAAICAHDLAWSPDGATLAFASGGVQNPCGDPADAGVWLWDVASGSLLQVAMGAVAGPLTWTAGGRIFADTVNAGQEQPVLLSPSGAVPSITLEGVQPRPIGAGPMQYTAGTVLYSRYVCTSSGKPANAAVDAVNLASVVQTQLSGTIAGFDGQLSPDGSQAAWISEVASDSLVSGAVDGSTSQTLLSGGAGMGLLGWSPDGGALVFTIGGDALNRCPGP